MSDDIPKTVKDAKTEYSDLAGWFSTANGELNGMEQRKAQIQQMAMSQKSRADLLRGWMLAKGVKAEDIEALEQVE